MKTFSLIAKYDFNNVKSWTEVFLHVYVHQNYMTMFCFCVGILEHMLSNFALKACIYYITFQT